MSGAKEMKGDMMMNGRLMGIKIMPTRREMLGQIPPVILDPRMTPALSYLHVMVWDEDKDVPLEGATVVAGVGGVEWREETDEQGIAHFGFPSAAGTPVRLSVDADGFVSEVSNPVTQASPTEGPYIGLGRTRKIAPVLVLVGVIALGAVALS